jgi:hypothetical protein
MKREEAKHLSICALGDNGARKYDGARNEEKGEDEKQCEDIKITSAC